MTADGRREKLKGGRRLTADGRQQKTKKERRWVKGEEAGVVLEAGCRN